MTRRTSYALAALVTVVLVAGAAFVLLGTGPRDEVIHYEVINTVEYRGRGTFRSQAAGVLTVAKTHVSDRDVAYTYTFHAESTAAPDEGAVEIAFPPLTALRDKRTERFVAGDELLRNFGLLSNAALDQIRQAVPTDGTRVTRTFRFDAPDGFPQRLVYDVRAREQELDSVGQAVALLAESDEFAYRDPAGRAPVAARHRILCVMDERLEDVLYQCSAFVAEARGGRDPGTLRIESSMCRLAGEARLSLEGLDKTFKDYVERLELAERETVEETTAGLPMWAMHSLAVRDMADVTAGAAIEGKPNFAICATIGLALLIDSGVSLATGALHDAGVIDWEWRGIPNYLGQGAGLAAAGGFEAVTGQDVDEELWSEAGGVVGDVASLFVPTGVASKGAKLVVKGGHVGVRAVKAGGAFGKGLRVSKGLSGITKGARWAQVSGKTLKQIDLAGKLIKAYHTGWNIGRVADKVAQGRAEALERAEREERESWGGQTAEHTDRGAGVTVATYSESARVKAGEPCTLCLEIRLPRRGRRAYEVLGNGMSQVLVVAPGAAELDVSGKAVGYETTRERWVSSVTQIPSMLSGFGSLLQSMVQGAVQSAATKARRMKYTQVTDNVDFVMPAGTSPDAPALLGKTLFPKLDNFQGAVVAARCTFAEPGTYTVQFIADLRTWIRGEGQASNLITTSVAGLAAAEFRKTFSCTVHVAEGRSDRKKRTGLGTLTVLAIDHSSSMSGHKLAAAKEAADRFLDVIATDNEVSRRRHQVGAVAFSTHASVVQRATEDMDDVADSVSRLRAHGSTNIYQALQFAFQEVEDARDAYNRSIILLSDGEPTTGGSKQDVLNGPVDEAARDGIPIHTVGLGEPGRGGMAGYDPAFLRTIAERTGGRYCEAQSAHELATIYFGVQHRASGDVTDSAAGRIHEGEKIDLGDSYVPLGTRELHKTVSYPGSELELILTDPLGRQVDKDYPGATWKSRTGMVYCIVRDPIPGMWNTAVYGKDVPDGGCPFSVIGSVREPPPPPDDTRLARISGGALLVLLALCAVSYGFSVPRVRRPPGRAA